MSVSRFRQKPLDNNRPLPIFREEDDPNILIETAALSRAVPDVPTGMEKEEEEVSTISSSCSQIFVQSWLFVRFFGVAQEGVKQIKAFCEE